MYYYSVVAKYGVSFGYDILGVGIGIHIILV